MTMLLQSVYSIEILCKRSPKVASVNTLNSFNLTPHFFKFQYRSVFKHEQDLPDVYILCFVILLNNSLVVDAVFNADKSKVIHFGLSYKKAEYSSRRDTSSSSFPLPAWT